MKFYSLSLFSRNESEIEMTGNREVKVKYVKMTQDREVKFQKKNFSRIETLAGHGGFSLGSVLWVLVSLCLYKTFGLNFADVTLADDDTNSILTDDVNRAIWS